MAAAREGGGSDPPCTLRAGGLSAPAPTNLELDDGQPAAAGPAQFRVCAPLGTSGGHKRSASCSTGNPRARQQEKRGRPLAMTSMCLSSCRSTLERAAPRTKNKMVAVKIMGAEPASDRGQWQPQAKSAEQYGPEPASEVKGRVFLEEGWHVSMQQLRPEGSMARVSGISR